MGLTKSIDVWQCYDCGDLQGRHNVWFEGDICEECNSNKPSLRVKVEQMYLDWLNNFITLDAFADYYEISKFKALRVIKIGRQLNGF